MKKGSRSLEGNNQKVESFFMTIAEFTKLAMDGTFTLQPRFGTE
jgi:hypothetical protein